MFTHNLGESKKLLVKREDRGSKPEGSENASSRLTLSREVFPPGPLLTEAFVMNMMGHGENPSSLSLSRG